MFYASSLLLVAVIELDIHEGKVWLWNKRSRRVVDVLILNEKRSKLSQYCK